jgi:Na+-translocating ferredoxin:NAD+ oxidoreductase RNF subunit RnfB
MSIIPDILNPILVIGGLGAVFGAGLGIAGRLLESKEDERLTRIKDMLPGVNCGGCGYKGCNDFAEGLFRGETNVENCPVGGKTLISNIAAILGIETEEFVRKTAFIKCLGYDDVAEFRYIYSGHSDCKSAQTLAGGGAKTCGYGCLGYGSCITVCKFDAIYKENGIAIVDKDKCTQCGVCVPACPRGLIDIIPYDTKMMVACNTRDIGKAVRGYCSVGCIGCKLCDRLCKPNAVKMIGNVAWIDPAKCSGCGECAAKCPTKAIVAEK